MPALIRMYVSQVLIGFVAAAVFVGGLLWLNVANLWHLVSTSDVGLIAVFMLWLSNGVVFAGVQFAIAVMWMAEDDKDDSGSGGHRVQDHALVPIPVENRDADAQARRRY